MIEFFKNIDWEIVLLVVGAVGTAFNFVNDRVKGFFLAPFRKKQAEAESTSATRVAKVHAKDQTLDLITKLEASITRMQEKIIELHDVVVEVTADKNLSILMNESILTEIKSVFNALIGMCEAHCDDATFCVSSLEKALLNFDKLFNKNDTDVG